MPMNLYPFARGMPVHPLRAMILLCFCLFTATAGHADDVPTPDAIDAALETAGRMEVRGDPFGAQFEYMRALRMQVLRAEEGGEDSALYHAHAEVYLDHLAVLAMETGETLDAADLAAWMLERDALAPLLRQRAAWVLAMFRLRQGEVEAARAASDRLRFLRDWWILGPFDNERGQGLEIPLAPETDGVDLDAVLPGKGQDVRWRHVQSAHPLGRVDLGASLYPNTEALAYAALMVRSDRAQVAAFRVGSDDSLVAWVNGVEVVRDDMQRRAVPDQRYPGVPLRSGWNLILLKVGQATDAWAFYARLTAPDGSLLAGLHVAENDEEMRTALAAYAAAESAVEAAPAIDVRGGALSTLAEQARRDPSDARTAYLLGLLLSRRGVFGVHAQADRQMLQRATRLAPDRAIYSLGLAEAADESFRLRPDRDENLKRMALEKALEIDPEAHGARVELARHHIEALENHTTAKEILKEVFASTLQCPPAQRLWFDVQAHYGWTAQAARTLEELVAREPGYRPARVRQAEFLLDTGTPEGARRSLQAALKLDATDIDVRTALAYLHVEAGEVAAAIALLREGLQVDPYALPLRDSLIRMLLDAGQTGAAREAVDAALRMTPLHPEILTRAGDVSLQEGEESAARASWEEALRMQPGAEGARRQLEWHGTERLRPTTPIPDPLAWANDAVTEVEEPVGFGTWTLLAERVHEVHGDGTRRETYQRLVRVLTPEGAQALGRFPIWYDGETERVEVHHARVLHPDGSVHEGEVVPISREGDRQVTLVAFAQIEPGDVVHLEFSRNQFRQSFFGDYFGSIHPFRQFEPTHLARYVLIHPTSRTFHVHRTGGAPAAVQDHEAEGYRTRVWTMRDLPAIETHPFMPPIRELSPTVQVSTFQDWDALATWYWHLIRSQNQSTPEIRRHVQTLTAGMRTDREKVAAIFDWVSREVRNNEWEFGVHGFKPYSAGVIFNRRFGDCKDKATLVNVMAREIGLEAWPVLIHATDVSRPDAGRGAEDLALPLLNHFNHCISLVHVDGETLFLDPTVLYRTIDSNPLNDAGGEALVVHPDGGERAQLPETTPERHRWEEETELVLAPDGVVDMRQEAVASGHAAVYMRAWFGNPRAWDHVIRALGRQHFGTIAAGTVEDFDASGVGADETRLQYRLRIRDFSHRRDRALRLRFPGLLVAGDVTKGFAFPETWMQFASASRREVDLVLPATYALRRTVHVRYPDGFVLRNRLRDLHKTFPFGRLDITFEEVGASLTVQYAFVIEQRRISVADYPAFRRMLHAADWMGQTELLLEKE